MKIQDREIISQHVVMGTLDDDLREEKGGGYPSIYYSAGLQALLTKGILKIGVRRNVRQLVSVVPKTHIGETQNR